MKFILKIVQLSSMSIWHHNKLCIQNLTYVKSTSYNTHTHVHTCTHACAYQDCGMLGLQKAYSFPRVWEKLFFKPSDSFSKRMACNFSSTYSSLTLEELLFHNYRRKLHKASLHLCLARPLFPSKRYHEMPRTGERFHNNCYPMRVSGSVRERRRKIFLFPLSILG